MRNLLILIVTGDEGLFGHMALRNESMGRIRDKFSVNGWA